MRKAHLSTFAAAAFGIGLAGAAHAVLPGNLVILHDWQFNDQEGTTSSQVVDSVGGSNFNNDINSSSTTANGTFQIQRNASVDNVYFGFAPISNNPGTGTLYLVVDIASWNYASVFPRFRAAFNNTIPGTTSTFAGQVASADFRPGDWDTNAANAGVGGFGSGSTADHIGYENDAEWGVSSTPDISPVRLVLAYDQDNHTYSVSYSIDGGSFVNIGSATTDPTWNANFVAFGGFNNFTGDGLEVDRLFVAVPEPSTYALIAGLGILGVAFWRRSRKGRQG